METAWRPVLLLCLIFGTLWNLWRLSGAIVRLLRGAPESQYSGLILGGPWPVIRSAIWFELSLVIAAAVLWLVLSRLTARKR